MKVSSQYLVVFDMYWGFGLLLWSATSKLGSIVCPALAQLVEGVDISPRRDEFGCLLSS